MRNATAESHHDFRETLVVELLTSEPGLVLTSMEAVATELDLTLWPEISDSEPMLAMLTRLRADLDRG